MPITYTSFSTITDKRLSDRDFRVLTYIYAVTSAGSRPFFVSLSKISTDCLCLSLSRSSEKAAAKSLKNLCEFGYIFEEKSKHLTKTYTVNQDHPPVKFDPVKIEQTPAKFEQAPRPKLNITPAKTEQSHGQNSTNNPANVGPQVIVAKDRYIKKTIDKDLIIAEKEQKKELPSLAAGAARPSSFFEEESFSCKSEASESSPSGAFVNPSATQAAPEPEKTVQRPERTSCVEAEDSNEVESLASILQRAMQAHLKLPR